MTTRPKSKRPSKAIEAIRFVGEISKLDLQADDILILTTELLLTVEQAAHLRARFDQRLAELGCKNPVIIMTAGLHMNVIRLPEPAREAT